MEDKNVPLGFQIELEIRNIGLWGEPGKTGVPKERPQNKERTNNKFNPHIMPGPILLPCAQMNLYIHRKSATFYFNIKHLHVSVKEDLLTLEQLNTIVSV